MTEKENMPVQTGWRDGEKVTVNSTMALAAAIARCIYVGPFPNGQGNIWLDRVTIINRN